MYGYKFHTGYQYTGSWHQTGIINDHIKSVGLYYFATNTNKQNTNFRFIENQIHLGNFYEDYATIDLENGVCIVFNNKYKHRGKINIGQLNKKYFNNEFENNIITKKVLCFYIHDSQYFLNKEIKDFHYVNYQYKLMDIINSMLEHKLDFSNDIIPLIRCYLCGNMIHQNKLIEELQKSRNMQWNQRNKKFISNSPEYVTHMSYV